ncbi:MAG: isoleucine--tRNA ligase [Proteobacteria bacterium]|nr:isoleucine--tRNA ligase [Pseudomonadota bacterium]
MPTDYKSTIMLPKTDFAMRAGLPKREPELLARWAAMGLFRKLREDSKGREKFILHDGPPYANGHLHIGTALNKILKDVVNRSQQMMGKDANYVPGWDCHGLPIEWQIEQKYRDAGKDKDEVPLIQFRQECREFAEKWIDIQREEFKRLGVEGDWDNPYATMDHASEANIAGEICKFLMNGGLYRGSKPVMWSVVEKTALAEAEVEYHDVKSPTIMVRFPVAPTREKKLGLVETDELLNRLLGASVVIWTTTPWTLPGNRAIALGASHDYGVFEVSAVEEGGTAVPGERLVLAADLADAVREEARIAEWRCIETFPGSDLAGAVCRHPFHGQGYDFDVPLLAADFVVMDQGTGFVHIAPGHGADDFDLGSRNGIEVPETVSGEGVYFEHVPLFAGRVILTPEGKDGDANGAVIEALKKSNALLARTSIVHSYPHSWRSKAPVIFRNTPQWFISMSANDLRKKALAAIGDVRWVPPQGRNRIHSMIENRPEWVVSRQRAWGVPITVFVDKRTGEPLRDEAVNKRIVDAIAAEGADAWFTSGSARFLGSGYAAEDYEKVEDIVDVWFESGSTHSFVLEQRDDLMWPASLYLEGSDQHRGWFHSSLLESCGTRGRAPFDAVLTHGFVMDDEGRKMSKSLGNVMSPQEVTDKHGADILRLWVVSSDYTEDLRIGPEILQRQVDAYRKLRNTLRFVLGNLNGFSDAERVEPADMPELERWVLHRLWELDVAVRRACNDFDFHAVYLALNGFCAADLSAFYFDVRKDSLYCDQFHSPRRRAARTVLDHVFSCLTAWLAPILCFTAEDAWLARFDGPDSSVHLRLFPEPPEVWRDDALAAKWSKVRDLRRVVTGALEIERREKRIGSSLQAHPAVYANAGFAGVCRDIDLADVCITSGITLVEAEPPADAFTLEDVPGVGAVPGLAKGGKCQRCWKVLPEVAPEGTPGPEICGRCEDAVAQPMEVSP